MSSLCVRVHSWAQDLGREPLLHRLELPQPLELEDDGRGEQDTEAEAGGIGEVVICEHPAQ